MYNQILTVGRSWDDLDEDEARNNDGSKVICRRAMTGDRNKALRLGQR